MASSSSSTELGTAPVRGTITPFNGTNVKPWKLDLIVALTALGLASHLKEPRSSSKVKSEIKLEAGGTGGSDDATYNRSFLTLWSSLLPSIKAQYEDHVDICDTFSLYWAILDRYEKLTIHDRSALFRSIVTAKLLGNESIETYVARVSSMATQLANANDPISSSQLKCCILDGLPEQYAVVRDIITHSHDYDTMTVQHVEKRLIEQQSRIKHAPTYAAAVYALKSKRAKFNKNVTCFRCGETGHVKSDCEVTETLKCTVCKSNKHNSKGHAAYEEHYGDDSDDDSEQPAKSKTTHALTMIHAI